MCLCVTAETIVNVLDFKKGIGLWHSVQTVTSRYIFIIFIFKKQIVFHFGKAISLTFFLSVSAECVEYVTCG